MNKSVLVGMISVAGLATSVFAQTGASNTATGHTIQLRLVADGTPGAPTSGVDLFPVNGSGYATAIGITVQVRVLRPPTVPNTNTALPPVAVQNFGISGLANGSISGTAPQLSIISVNDPLGQAQLQRGRTPSGGGTPSSSLYGAFNPFRGTFSGSGENNTQTGGNRATGNATGAALPATLVKNGFIDYVGGLTTNNQQIRGLDLGYGANLNNRTAPLPTFSNDPNATDNWQNVYRFIFIPRSDIPNLDPREIVITMTAWLRFIYAENYAEGDPEDPTDDRWTYFGLSEIVMRDATLRFFVPTPGAAALLGIGGMVAMRRRRA